MSAYTGYLIRRERLAQNLSQEGLAKGICAASYLSKIEQGLVEPGEEIIDRLFAALSIDFVRDPALEEQAQRQLGRFYFLMEAGEPYEAEKAFFDANRERLMRSEFALSFRVFELASAANANQYNREEMLARLADIEPFMHCLSVKERRWALLVKAEHQENWEDEWDVLEQAARLGSSCLVAYKQANCAYSQGKYSLSVELGEQAYSLASYEGNPATMIWSSFLLGSCACNRYDLNQAKRYYDRAIALTRGHREDLTSYADYNLGSTYLEIGDDENALRYLRRTGEREEDAYHNLLLHQKLAILLLRTDAREEGLERLAKAKSILEQTDWVQWQEPALLEQMIRFAELLYEDAFMDAPEFEQVTRLLYKEAGERYGHGFKRFYGRYLIELYKRQRRYKDALLVREEMEGNKLS